MRTIKEIIAEVLTQLRKYDDLGLIDYITLKEVILSECRRFGSNVMELRHGIVEIVGGFGKLPEGFYKLDWAMLYVPVEDADCEDEEDWRNVFEESKVRVTDYEWDNQSNSHYRKAYKEITVKKKIRGQEQRVRLRPYIMPSLTKGLSRDILTDSCLNKKVNRYGDYPQISLSFGRIMTNFKEGDLVIQYRGLPEVDGEVCVDSDDNLINYLIYQSCAKMLETMWTNDDIQGVGEKLSYYKAEANRYKDLADISVKFNNLPPDWNKSFERRNKKYLRKHNPYGRL